MRVLHVLNGRGGGATISALELVKASRACGTGVEHCAVYPGRPGLEVPEIHRVFRRARPIPLPAWNRPRTLDLLRRLALFVLTQKESGMGVRTARTFDQVIEDWSIDVVTTNCAVNIHGALAARRAGVPHVWHIRERIGTDGSMQFRLDGRRLVHRIAGLSTRIAAVSEYVSGPFRKFGADEGIEVVYDGVDVAAFESTEARHRGRELRRKRGVPDEAMLVGKVANVTAYVKRHDLFLRAAAEVARYHNDVWFVVVGAIPSGNTWLARPSVERWQKLKALAHDLGLDGRLVWAGNVDDPPAIMNAIDIMAHTCPIEGFPRVVLEAMAAGKPVVGPAAGGVPEVVGDTTGWLVEQQTPQDLANGIQELLLQDTERIRLAAAGRTRVEAEFSSQRHIARMVDLYRRACDPREPRPRSSSEDPEKPGPIDTALPKNGGFAGDFE